MKRRSFLKAMGAVSAAASVAVSQGVAAATAPAKQWAGDVLADLNGWINEKFRCSQGILGPYADEEGEQPYITWRAGVVLGSGVDANKAKVDLVTWMLARFMSVHKKAATMKEPRPILLWRTPLYFNDESPFETGNVYNTIEIVARPVIRLRCRLFVPRAPKVYAVAEGARLLLLNV